MRTSIVMAVHGNWPVARRALEALRLQLDESREVIVVDDASPEPVPQSFPVPVVRNERPLGFGPSCNRGAGQARGEFLCFLNSDALVEPGALDALEAAASEEGHGAVAATLLDEDGAVQESGCAIGLEGTTFPLGRGADADDGRWSFRREVDYGSAACLLVRRQSFEELGGFDDRYAPGYYEDADLCLRLAERGLRTVVEPAARAVHLQWGSGTRERAKALVRRNQEVFLERWGDRFANRPIVVAAQPWPHRELALRDAIALTRFLVVEDVALAEDVAGRWSGSRVTLLGSREAPDGIERADPSNVESWLEDRRFHYSAILGAEGRFATALDRSQPQAARLEPGSRLVEALATAGVAPPDGEVRG